MRIRSAASCVCLQAAHDQTMSSPFRLDGFLKNKLVTNERSESALYAETVNWCIGWHRNPAVDIVHSRGVLLSGSSSDCWIAHTPELSGSLDEVGSFETE